MDTHFRLKTNDKVSYEETFSYVSMCSFNCNNYECKKCSTKLYENEPKKPSPTFSFEKRPYWFFQNRPQKNEPQKAFQNVFSALNNTLLVYQDSIVYSKKERDHKMVWILPDKNICSVRCSYEGCLFTWPILIILCKAKHYKFKINTTVSKQFQSKYKFSFKKYTSILIFC